MIRPSWDKTYMDMCETLACRSTCLRIQTASVIVKENIIVSVGYNGVASGQEHCHDYWREIYDMYFDAAAFIHPLTEKEKTCIRMIENDVLLRIGLYDATEMAYQCAVEKTKNFPCLSFDEFLQTGFFYTQHHEWSNNNELHGEMNAILFAGRNGISLGGATIYTIYSPCINCAKAILTAGITKVVYSKLYKRCTIGIKFLEHRGIIVNQLL